jgi:hypothetical protein
LFVCAVYNPSGKYYEFSNQIYVMLSNASVGDNEIVLLGDFNCNNIRCKEVNELKFVCEMHQLQQTNYLPTRVTDRSSTIIYLFFASRLELYDECGVTQTSIIVHLFL